MRGGVKIGYDANGAHLPLQLSSEKAYVTLTKNGINSAGFNESYLEWGGKNFAGTYGPIDSAINPVLSPNRLAGFKPEGVLVEYTNDGTTWLTYNLTNEQKTSLFTTSQTIYIGGPKPNNVTPNSKVRVTIDGVDGDCYTALNKMHIYISTSYSQNTKVTMESYDYNSSTSWHQIITDQPISDWSGWNVLNFRLPGSGSFGGTNTPTHQRKIRLTFSHTHVTTGKEANGLQITKIYAYGGVGWSTPSTLAETGVPYTYNYAGAMRTMNDVYPANNALYSLGYSNIQWKSIYGVNIYENGTSLSNKYLGINSKATDSAKLNGQAASYYAAASQLANYLPLAGGTMTGTLNSKKIVVGGANAPITLENISATIDYAKIETPATRALHLQAPTDTYLVVGDTTYSTDREHNYKLIVNGVSNFQGPIKASGLEVTGADYILGFDPNEGIKIQKTARIGNGSGTFNLQVKDQSTLQDVTLYLPNINGATLGTLNTIQIGTSSDINTVGTPSVTVTNDGDTSTLTFHKLKGATGATGPKGETGSQGLKGTTFTPSVSSAGVISWTNDGGLTNPSSINIKGPTGATGPQGPKGNDGTSVSVSSITYQKSSSNTTIPTGTWSTNIVAADAGGYLWTKTTFSDGKIAYSVARQGANGAKGDQGPQGNAGANGYTFTPSVATNGDLSWTKAQGSGGSVPATVNIKGPQGIQGPKGETGAAGTNGVTPTITASATVGNTTGTPSVTVTKGGTTTNPSFTFAFQNLKGAKGDPGVNATTTAVATTTANGLMSKEDKTKLNNIATGATAVTQNTVTQWGFTKNAGTITGITMNGVSKGTSGVVNLGTVLTAHQTIKINGTAITPGRLNLQEGSNITFSNSNGTLTITGDETFSTLWSGNASGYGDMPEASLTLSDDPGLYKFLIIVLTDFLGNVHSYLMAAREISSAIIGGFTIYSSDEIRIKVSYRGTTFSWQGKLPCCEVDLVEIVGVR